MAQGLADLRGSFVDVDAAVAADCQYDLAVWAAGYEARSAWLISSVFRPNAVSRWMRVEFREDRLVHSAPHTLSIDLGELVGGMPGHRSWDGLWAKEWGRLLRDSSAAAGRRLKVFCDYSSMPRTVYGTLVSSALVACREAVESLTMAYVPGIHGVGVDGSHIIEGMRALIGTEGKSSQDQSPAFIIGLGYDGCLAESIVELFQVATYGCVYADPGVHTDSVARVLAANANVLRRAEVVATASAWSISDCAGAYDRIRGWYRGRDVVLVPLGPKPHVLASIVAALEDRSLALRFPQMSEVTPVQVTVASDARPFVTRVVNAE